MNRLKMYKITNHNKIQDKLIYKFNEKKSGNRQLDKGLAELKYNSMPNIVHFIVGGLA